MKIGDLVRYKWQESWSCLGKRDWHKRWDNHYGLVVDQGITLTGREVLYVKFKTGVTTRVYPQDIEIVARHQ